MLAVTAVGKNMTRDARYFRLAFPFALGNSAKAEIEARARERFAREQTEYEAKLAR